MKHMEENNIKMSPLMKAMKAAHSVVGNAGTLVPEELDKRRHSEEVISKLATPSVGITFEKLNIGEMEAQWTFPKHAYPKKPIILYCHGGGFSCGGLGYAGVLSGKLAIHTGLAVLSYAYRLTPEYPYPAAIEDTMQVWDYLMHLGYGADDIILAGDSAGGNLALELTLLLKEQKRMLPKALILMSPWTDMTATASSYKKYQDVDPILTYDYIMIVRKAYLQDDTDYANPRYSPLFADLSGFPPTMIQVGSNEILRSDSEHLLKALHKANCHAVLEIYKGAWHVFQQMPIPKASKALDDVKSFIDSIV